MGEGVPVGEEVENDADDAEEEEKREGKGEEVKRGSLGRENLSLMARDERREGEAKGRTGREEVEVEVGREEAGANSSRGRRLGWTGHGLEGRPSDLYLGQLRGEDGLFLLM